MAMGRMLAVALAWDEVCCMAGAAAAVATGLMLAILGVSVDVGLQENLVCEGYKPSVGPHLVSEQNPKEAYESLPDSFSHYKTEYPSTTVITKTENTYTCLSRSLQKCEYHFTVTTNV